MTRAVKSRSALAVCLTALLAVAAPAEANASAAATEQYQLTLPGVERGGAADVAPGSEPEPVEDAGAGVTGERTAVDSPLSTLLGTVSSPWVLLALAAAAAVAVAATRREPESP